MNNIDLEIDFNELEKYYILTIDGMIYSKIRPRWLKPQKNSCGYIHYYLTFGVPKKGWYSASRLVTLRYIGKPPTPDHEVDHIDTNKLNNHFTNLQWLTHSENQQKIYSNGRVHILKGIPTGRKGILLSINTRKLMSEAKKKPILFDTGSNLVIYNSIEDAARELKTYRKKIYTSIKTGRKINNGVLSYYK